MNNKRWNIVSNTRFVLHMQVLLEYLNLHLAMQYVYTISNL